MEFDWDPRKAVINLRKHGVDFADAGTVLHDEQAITIHNEGSDDEDRFVTLGMDALGRVLVLVYTSREDRPRLISARKAPIRGGQMKKQYDFRDGRRGAVLRAPSGKTRITIRLDDDVLQWFKDQVHKAGGGSYQTLINDALRRFAESADQNLEGTLRRVLREELPRYGVLPRAGLTRR